MRRKVSHVIISSLLFLSFSLLLKNLAYKKVTVAFALILHETCGDKCQQIRIITPRDAAINILMIMQLTHWWCRALKSSRRRPLLVFHLSRRIVHLQHANSCYWHCRRPAINVYYIPRLYSAVLRLIIFSKKSVKKNTQTIYLFVPVSVW